MRGPYKPESKNRNTLYTRSKVVKKPILCRFAYLEQCKGRFEIHHIDEDITNNNPENLIELCTSHHRLVHKGRFDLNNPKKFDFKISSGKRRYKYE